MLNRNYKWIGIIVAILLISAQFISVFLTPFPIRGKIDIVKIDIEGFEIDDKLNVSIIFDVLITNTGFYKIRNKGCQSPTLGKYDIRIDRSITENGSFNDFSERMLVSCGNNFPEIVKSGDIISESISMKFEFSIGTFKFRLFYGGPQGLETKKDVTLVISSLTPFVYSIVD